MPSNTLTLNIKVNNAGAVSGLEGTSNAVAEMCKNIVRDIDATFERIERLNKINLKGIIDQIELVKTSAAGAAATVTEASKALWDMGGTAADAAKSLRTVGTNAAAADDAVFKLGVNAVTTGDALADVGAGANLASPALTTLQGEARATSTAVSGMGRSATGATTKLRGLGTVTFDPVKIVTGAGGATAALNAATAAAGRVRAAVNGAARANIGMVTTRGGVIGGGRAAAHGGGALFNPFAAGFGLLRGGAVGVTAVGGASAFLAGSLDTRAQKILGNTNATQADAKAMRQSVMDTWRMGQLDDEQSMMSFMHVLNHQFRNGDARRINRGAAMLRISTGANQEAAGNVISGFMHNLEMPATDRNVSRVMNLIHQATASGNLTLEQMNQYGFSRGIGSTMSLAKTRAGQERTAVEGLAFVTALTQHTIQAPQAATNLRGITWQILHPTDKAQKAIDALGLKQYFGDGALDKYGIREILDVTRQRTGGNRQKLLNIFGNKQGGFGAAIATGVGWKDFNKNLYDPVAGNYAAWSGQAKPIEHRYAQAQATPGQQWNKLMGRAKADFLPIGEKLLPIFEKAEPIIARVLDKVASLMDRFTKLPKPIQEAALAFGGFAIAAKALESITGISAILPGLGEKFGLVGKAAGVVGAEGEAAAAGLKLLPGPIGIAVGAATLLFVSWKTNFGGIQNVVHAVIKNVTDFFKKNLPEIQETVKTVTAFVETLFHSHGGRLQAIFSHVWKLLGTIVTTALNLIEGVLKVWMDVINGHWDKAASDWKNIWVKLWAGLKGIIYHIVTGIGNILAGIIQLVIDIGIRVFKAALNVGKSIVDGIVNGVKSKWSALIGFLHGLGTGLVKTFNIAIDAHSPSRKFYKSGVAIGQGLADGIKSTVGLVNAALAEHTRRLEAIDKFFRQRGLGVNNYYRRREAAVTNRPARAEMASKHAAANASLADQHREAHDAEQLRYKQEQTVQRDEERAAKHIRQMKTLADLARQQIANSNATYAQAGTDQSGMQFASSRTAAKNKYDARLNALGGGIYTGPYTKQQLADFAAAMKEYENRLAAIQQREDALAANRRRMANERMNSAVDLLYGSGDMTPSSALAYYQKQLAGFKDMAALVPTAGKSGDVTSLASPEKLARLGEYINLLQKIHELNGQISAANRKAEREKTAANAKVAVADRAAIRVKLADIKAQERSGHVWDAGSKSFTGADYTKQDAVTALQGLLPSAASYPVLSANIKSEIANLSKDGGLSAESRKFWDSFMEPLDNIFRDALDNIFRAKGKRRSSKELWQGFLEGEINAVVKYGGDKLSTMLQGAMFGAKGKGNPLDGLFGRHRAVVANATMAASGAATNATNAAASVIQSAGNVTAQIPKAMKQSRASMLEGAGAIMASASALMVAMNPKKAKKAAMGGLLGMVIGGIVGSMTGGAGWMAGASFGGGLGSMMGAFANGGVMSPFTANFLGERGREIGIPLVPTLVIPNNVLKALGGDNGGRNASARPVFYGGHTTVYNGAIYEASDVARHQREQSIVRERTTRTPGSIPVTF